MWGIDVSDHVFYLENGTTWQRIQGSMKVITTGVDGVWALNQGGDVFYRTGTQQNGLTRST